MKLAELEETILQKKHRIKELRAALVEVWTGPQDGYESEHIAELRETLIANWTGPRASLFLNDPYTNVGVPADQGPIMEWSRGLSRSGVSSKELIQEFVSTVDEVNLLIKQLPRRY